MFLSVCVAVLAGREGERPLRGGLGFVFGDGLGVAADGGVFGRAVGGGGEPFAGGLIVVAGPVADDVIGCCRRPCRAESFSPTHSIHWPVSAALDGAQSFGEAFEFRRSEIWRRRSTGWRNRIPLSPRLLANSLTAVLDELRPGFFIREGGEVFAKRGEGGGALFRGSWRR